MVFPDARAYLLMIIINNVDINVQETAFIFPSIKANKTYFPLNVFRRLLRKRSDRLLYVKAPDVYCS